jgi:quinoprotein dehydrogenase-associated probable ABC transporter substrate-binding protein
MSFPFRDPLARLIAMLSLATTALTGLAAEPLRVCADPDNLPFSHADGSGFENRIAEIAAAELARPLEYFWIPQRRGFVRKSIDERHCDVWMGVPADFERLLATAPYYRAPYVVVSTAAVGPLRAIDDPRFARLRIGVQLVGNDMAATPPAQALARGGVVDKVRGFPLDGDVPAAARMVAALERGELDALLLWGPQAGWFTRLSHGLLVAVVQPPRGFDMPFEFAIAMGVQRGNTALRDALQGVIERRRDDIDAILASYAVLRSDLRGNR